MKRLNELEDVNKRLRDGNTAPGEQGDSGPAQVKSKWCMVPKQTLPSRADRGGGWYLLAIKLYWICFKDEGWLASSSGLCLPTSAYSTYSQLLPCGHLVITDTPIIRTTGKSQAKLNCRYLTVINSHCYALSWMRTLTCILTVSAIKRVDCTFCKVRFLLMLSITKWTDVCFSPIQKCKQCFLNLELQQLHVSHLYIYLQGWESAILTWPIHMAPKIHVVNVIQFLPVSHRYVWVRGFVC